LLPGDGPGKLLFPAKCYNTRIRPTRAKPLNTSDYNFISNYFQF